MPGSYTVKASVKLRSGAIATATATVNVYIRMELIAGIALASIIAASSIILLKRRKLGSLARLA
jgi:hypothetical protein